LEIRLSKKIALLAGGISKERDISLESGKAVFNALKELNYSVELIDPKNGDLNSLINFDSVFICLHGENGEDGKIQSFLDLMGIPYTGSRSNSSMIAMDKLLTKLIWEKLGFITPKFKIVNSTTQFDELLSSLGAPFIIKPAKSGSSLGVSIVNSQDDLVKAYRYAIDFDSTILAEEFIKGRELTVSVLGEKALEVIEIETTNSFYDYNAKYLSDETTFSKPIDITEKELKSLKENAIEAFRALGCSSWGRVDYIMDKKGKFYLIEVNTIPGMTGHSLFPLAAKYSGMTFNTVVEEIVKLIK
jgi:D-alanine-D-alanine ligase